MGDNKMLINEYFRVHDHKFLHGVVLSLGHAGFCKVFRSQVVEMTHAHEVSIVNLYLSVVVKLFQHENCFNVIVQVETGVLGKGLHNLVIPSF